VLEPKPRGRQGRAYSPEELAELLRAALGELMADGTPFRDLSVERIVSVAGVARSTFYLSFEDKAAMLTALSAHSLQRLYQGPRSWIRRGPEATRDDIFKGLRQLLDDFLEDEVVLRAVAEASVYDTSVREGYRSAVDDYARAMARMIRAGRREGRMRDVEPVETAEALAWMTERTVSRIVPGSSPARLDATAEAMADIFWRTLFP
jgi:TetR/AcrR family transcriptional regulator, ethionamide resistance regulator